MLPARSYSDTLKRLQPAGSDGRYELLVVVVVLVGAGHVQYGMGIERQLRKTFPGRIASLIPVPVKDSRLGAIASVLGR